MKRYLLCGVALCLWSLDVRGSPNEVSSSAEMYLNRVKPENSSGENINEPPNIEFLLNLNNSAALLAMNQSSSAEQLSLFTSFDYSSVVDFYLYQEVNGAIEMKKIPIDATKILEAGFQKRSETKVVIHGYFNSVKSDVVKQITQTFLSNFKYNIISVDWSKITNNPLYPIARYAVEGVGEYVGELLSALYNANYIKASNLHLIGHSLGAHVASYAGKAVQRKNWSIRRITGLDPAGPLFQDPNTRLSKNDAGQVDVIHTCKNYLGIDENIGHIDFYPNGGTWIQPGCNLDIPGSCSHGRSYEYFVESITRSEAFIGIYCPDQKDLSNCDDQITGVMGESLIYNQEGAYFLQTAGSSPFGLGSGGYS